MYMPNKSSTYYKNFLFLQMPATVTYKMHAYTYRVERFGWYGLNINETKFGETNKGCFETCGPNF